MVAVVSCCAFAGVVWAAASYFTAANGKWTSVSGVAHVHKKQYKPKSTKYGLSSFNFSENKDDPVQINVGTTELCNNNCKSGDSHKLQVRDPMGAMLPQLWGVAVAEDHYVTAIQVCLNGKDDSAKKKIKGLKLWGSRLKADGTLVADSSPNKKELNNCKEWQDKISCPSGKIATGVKAHYVSDKVGFAGLALHCSSIKKL